MHFRIRYPNRVNARVSVCILVDYFTLFLITACTKEGQVAGCGYEGGLNVKVNVVLAHDADV